MRSSTLIAGTALAITLAACGGTEPTDDDVSEVPTTQAPTELETTEAPMTEAPSEEATTMAPTESEA
jgi:ABC-type glycerol-3-phosphate transport system substrate-binding protein